jgi:hypothetical protein
VPPGVPACLRQVDSIPALGTKDGESPPFLINSYFIVHRFFLDSEKFVLNGGVRINTLESDLSIVVSYLLGGCS